MAVRTMQEQLDAAKAAPKFDPHIDLFARLTPERLLRGAYRIAQNRRSYRGMPLWCFVGDVTGHGSTYSQDICRAFGWNPDLKIPAALPPWNPQPTMETPARQNTGAKDCPKCGGAGWLRGSELDNPSDDTCADSMTKYSCDSEQCRVQTL